MSDLPKIDINRVFRLRDKLFSKVFEPYSTHLIDTAVFQHLVTQTRQEIGQSLEYNVVFESLRCLLGQELSRQAAYTTSWRLAANVDKLADNRPAPPWVCQRHDEWVPVGLQSVKKDRNHRGRIGYRYVVRFLTGEAAGLESTVFWQFKIARMAARAAGFSFRNSSSYRFEDPAQLVGLRIFVFVEATRSTTTPYFFQFDCPQSVVNWNRTHILRGRLRISAECPRGFTHPCHRCAIGRDQCDFATHSNTYYADYCNECQRDGRPFDPASPTFCVSCTTKKRMNPDATVS